MHFPKKWMQLVKLWITINVREESNLFSKRKKWIKSIRHLIMFKCTWIKCGAPNNKSFQTYQIPIWLSYINCIRIILHIVKCKNIYTIVFSYVPKTCFTSLKPNKHSRAYLICSFRQSNRNVTLITFHSLLLYLHCKYSKTFELYSTQATTNHVKPLMFY